MCDDIHVMFYQSIVVEMRHQKILQSSFSFHYFSQQNFTYEKRYPFLRILLYFVKHNFLQMVLMSLLFIFVNLPSSFTVCKNHSWEFNIPLLTFAVLDFSLTISWRGHFSNSRSKNAMRYLKYEGHIESQCIQYIGWCFGSLT